MSEWERAGLRLRQWQGTDVMWEVMLQVKNQSDWQLFHGFRKRKERDLPKRGGKMIPGSPAREQAGGRNSDIRRACQNWR